jgi:hypothetical protein
MTVIPKTPIDLVLAPVAAEIDRNLRSLRDADPGLLVDHLAFSLNADPGRTREERARQVLEVATRQVELHGWTAVISDDATRLQLRGGSVELDVGLSARLRDYIERG